MCYESVGDGSPEARVYSWRVLLALRLDGDGMSDKTFYTYDEWKETYLPVMKQVEDDLESHLFETFGDDLAFVNSCNKLHVWTLVETDDGPHDVIVEGFRFVNRLGYFVTVRPWSEPVEVEL